MKWLDKVLGWEATFEWQSGKSLTVSGQAIAIVAAVLVAIIIIVGLF